MRLFAILLLVLIAGLGFALWQGIDLGTGRLAATGEVEEVELTAADPEAVEAASEEAPAVDPEAATAEPDAVEAAEAPAEGAEVPAETAEAPAAATEVPGETAAAPAETAEVPATETAAVEEPASPDAAPDSEAEIAETIAAETAEAPASAEPSTETAEAPAPRTLPEDPLDPTDALAEIAPDLSVPSAPPVRTTRAAEPAEEPAVATTEPAVEPSATNLASAAPDTRRLTADRVNLRQGPDTGTASLGLLSLDESVEVLESEGDWARVRTQDGEEGWVAARFLAAPPG